MAARAVYVADSPILVGFLVEGAAPGPTVYSDGAPEYGRIPFDLRTVEHTEERVRGDTHTIGLESFESIIKHAFEGTFHKLSPKHLDRYVREFAGRYSLRERGTIEMMAAIATGMQGKRLRYR